LGPLEQLQINSGTEHGTTRPKQLLNGQLTKSDEVIHSSTRTILVLIKPMDGRKKCDQSSKPTNTLIHARISLHRAYACRSIGQSWLAHLPAASAEALPALLDEGGRLLVDVGRRPEPAPPRRGPAARLLPCPAGRRRLAHSDFFRSSAGAPCLLPSSGRSSLIVTLFLIFVSSTAGAGRSAAASSSAPARFCCCSSIAVAAAVLASPRMVMSRPWPSSSWPLNSNSVLLQPMVAAAVSQPLGDALLLLHGQAVRQVALAGLAALSPAPLSIAAVLVFL
jgi:hypothetical protein